MKAFFAPSTLSYNRDRDCLILASTKKDALVEFRSLRDSLSGPYKAKDFKEVHTKKLDVYAIDIHSQNYDRGKEQKIPTVFCFKPKYKIETDVYVFQDNIILAETEKTYKEMIEIFKEQNNDMLLDLFY